MPKKLLAALVLGVVILFAAPATPAVAAFAPGVAAGPVAQQTTAPPGPRISPTDIDRANAQNTKSKIVVGGTAVVLAAIVLWGRSVRRKRRKSAGN